MPRSAPRLSLPFLRKRRLPPARHPYCRHPGQSGGLPSQLEAWSKWEHGESAEGGADNDTHTNQMVCINEQVPRCGRREVLLPRTRR